MAYVILGLVVIVVIYLATKSFSKSVNKNTLVGLYLAAGVMCVGTLVWNLFATGESLFD